MRKFISTILAFIMATSMVFAVDYNDVAAVDYDEAVEVLSAVGVLVGDDKGNFNPDEALSRAAAAKIVTYLMIGADAAEGLVGSAVFSDVPANHWAAGYISYLMSEGVVAGVGDNKFNPNGEVTALEFAKMLLVALGYDADLAKLTGSDWAISASKLAYGKKLFKGNDAVKMNSTATRQEAALYAFNALNAQTIYYANKGTNITIGDTAIVTGASDASNSGKLLREELFNNDLRMTSVTANNYGYPATQWFYKGQIIGAFAQDAVVTFVIPFNANELIDAVENVGYFFDTSIDGIDYDTSLTVSGLGTMTPDVVNTWLASNAKSDFNWTAYGKRVDVFANEDNIVNKIIVTDAELVQVEGKVEDKYATKTIDERAIYAGSYAIYVNDEVVGFDSVFASIEEDDYIVVIPGVSGVAEIYVPETVTGDVTYFKTGSSLTIRGINYEMTHNANIAVTAGDEDVTVFIDKFGYAIGAVGGSTAAESLVVLDVYSGLNADGAIVDMALVLYADGTTARVEVGTGAPVEGNAYTYIENSTTDKVDFYTNFASNIFDPDEGDTFAVSGQTIAESAKSVSINGTRVFFANGAKFIFVSQNSTNSWKYTVSNKLQDIASTVPVYAVIDADGNISTLYILGVSAKNTIKDGSALIFVAAEDGTVSKLDAEGKLVNLTQYVAFIDGVQIEGFVSEDAVAAGFYENEYDSANNWYILSGNEYNDITEDIKVGTISALNKDMIYSNKYITVDGVDVELTSATKYASAIEELDISALAELKAEISDAGSSVDIAVVYDGETGIALYVYVTGVTH